MLFALEAHMSEEDLELLVTLDDPGQDAQEVDSFRYFQAGNAVAYQPFNNSPQGGYPTSELKIMALF